MSFGYTDATWVDPDADEREERECRDCYWFYAHPSSIVGWCKQCEEYVGEMNDATDCMNYEE